MEKKIILLFISFLLVGMLQATILNIPADYPTIQTGIDSSSTGDTVLVQPGTYVENINFNGNNITVASLFLTTQDTSYISQTVIDGNHTNSVVRFINGEDTTAVLTGFTITNGYGFWGGGISCMNSSPKILYNYISDNETFYLMGIYDGGGGIWCAGGSPLIYSNKILHNNVEHGYGGGIVCCQSSPEIKNTEININYSSEEDLNGGGIFYCDSSEVNIVNCNIHDNIANDGGGIYCDSNSGGEIKNSTIQNNEAFDPYGGCGAGVYCKNYSNIIFLDVIIAENNCEYLYEISYGGGIFCDKSNINLINCEFFNNNTEIGGQVYCFNNSKIQILNNRFKYNFAADGGCIYCDESCIIIEDSFMKYSDALNYGASMNIINNSFVTLKNVSITYGWASVGGAIYIEDSNLDISCCYFYKNIACDGGNIITNNSNLNIYNSVFNKNESYSGGSAIDARSGSDVYCCNITVTDNYAQTSCGGIKCSSTSNLEMYNSILWNDTQPEIIGNNVSVMYSDIQGGWIGTGNIDIDPMFADTLNEDYRLTENSPCIDTGISDTTGLNIPPWDMEGNKRMWDGNGDGIAVIDMGAYEYDAPSYSIDPPDIQNTLLMYNFPNPTKTSTTIHYSLKQNSYVKISIYNIKGQLVSTLVNEDKPKGDHSVIYHTEKLNSGVYFYKIETYDLFEIKKLVVIK